MNKRKRVAWAKHRQKRKKLEGKRREAKAAAAPAGRAAPAARGAAAAG